ncbi:MAG: tyrosine--tRNA ligase, partial [Cutibacterium avidum]|nr:tyrosine--tRNA ligase [Cutibacterium avidum]
MSDLLDDLEWRGLVADSTDREALEAHLAQGPVTFYVGFDPTAKSLHIGHLVQLMLVRALQERGHKPLLLVGGATGLIGDPKMTGERQMNDHAVVAEWVESIKEQVSKYVDTEGPNAARIVNNYDWTVEYTALDFLRDVGKYFSINR